MDQCLDLVTIAGTEYTMQANLTQYEDVAELEDDILCFLPTVSDLDVFGCELDLLDLRTQQPLPEAFRTALLQRPQPQIVVRPCMVDGHSIFFFPRVRTPCGHGAQVIIEGKEKQSDGGEKDKDNTTTNQTNQTTANHSPQAESPPSCSLSSVLR